MPRASRIRPSSHERSWFLMRSSGQRGRPALQTKRRKLGTRGAIPIPQALGGPRRWVSILAASGRFSEGFVRQDLDRLMQEKGLAGLVVFAYDRYSPALYYVTGQKIHYGIYFRGADGRAHLIHDPMERDAAAAVGCDHSGFA